MVTFLIAGRVWGDLTKAAQTSTQPAHVAVAYFGKNSKVLLPLRRDSALVVDASEATVGSGQTSPSDLAALHRSGIRVFSYPNLHAKVFVFDRLAFVGSSNVSRRSSSTLTEAILETSKASAVRAARSFVQSLCLDELDARRLRELERIYRPPKIPQLIRAPTARGQILLMDLTLEQGVGRETQVQPPNDVWLTYFGFDVKNPARPPKIVLRNVHNSSRLETRWPVHHDHNWTLEINDATLPRPAMLRMSRAGSNSYSYEVLRPADRAYSELQKVLAKTRNPRQRRGRKWLIV